MGQGPQLGYLLPRHGQDGIENFFMTSDLNCLLMVWNSVEPGFPSGEISIRTWRKDLLVDGSFLSRSRLVAISLVTADASPAVRADCLARHEANLALLSREVTALIVGTSCILVPSGKIDEEELYHLLSLSLTSCKRSTAHSTWSALIFLL